jgi:hypothetical protein
MERRVGQALHAMTSDEGLTLREAVDWCGAGLTLREASRLRRRAAAENDPLKLAGCGRQLPPV